MRGYGDIACRRKKESSWPQVWWGGASGIAIDIPLLIDAAFAAGSAMIAFGAVLGKATPTQMLWLTFIMIPIYAVRQLASGQS